MIPSWQKEIKHLLRHLHDNVEILSRNDTIPHQAPALVEQSILTTRFTWELKSLDWHSTLTNLHPVQDKPRHLPWETDRALPDLSHKGSSSSTHLRRTKMKGNKEIEPRVRLLYPPQCLSMGLARARPWVCGKGGCRGAPLWTAPCAPWNLRSCWELQRTRIGGWNYGAKSPMQDVEVPRMVSVPTNLSTSPHTFLLSSSTSGTHSWMYLAPVTHSARLSVPLEEVLKMVRTEKDGNNTSLSN